MTKLIELDKVLEILLDSDVSDSECVRLVRKCEKLPIIESNSESGWISVDERLPDNSSEEVIIKMKNGNIYIARHEYEPRCDVMRWNLSNSFDYADYNSVKFWSYLPLREAPIK